VRRHALITLLGGVAVAWPVMAQAQQPAMPVVGLLSATSPEANADSVHALRQGLKDIGYVEGENVGRCPVFGP
jgi:putative tryptophan/tyrosine transport system substrate-binding protein